MPYTFSNFRVINLKYEAQNIYSSQLIRENIKSTMMILVILVISGLVLVDGECQTDDAPPDRKLNVVVYGLNENPSNTTRQERLQMDIKSATSAFSNF